MSDANAPAYKAMRNRPFLVIHFSFHPTVAARTERKDWQHTHGNMHIQESPSVVDRITDKINRSATVIIDILDERVVRNRIPDLSDDAVVKYYMEKFASMVDRGKAVYGAMQKQPA